MVSLYSSGISPSLQLKQVSTCFRLLIKFYYCATHYSAKRSILRLHIVRSSICPSVCNVDGSGTLTLEILEANCTDN